MTYRVFDGGAAWSNTGTFASNATAQFVKVIEERPGIKSV